MKRVHDYMTTGKDKDIVDPDPDRINSHRKGKQYTRQVLILQMKVRNCQSFCAVVAKINTKHYYNM